jgi:hypothetical protein
MLSVVASPSKSAGIETAGVIVVVEVISANVVVVVEVDNVVFDIDAEVEVVVDVTFFSF